MKTIQVGRFKAELSSILEAVQKEGETFVIAFGKRHKKIAMLVPYVEEKRARRFGQLRGKVVIPDNFDDENEAVNALFYGSKL